MVFCKYKASPGCILTFDTHSPTITTNTSILKPGEELEIKAGVSAFSKTGSPIIKFDGKTIPLSEWGFQYIKRKCRQCLVIMRYL
jgi:hypothetical protein